MDQFTRNDLQDLVADRDGPCVSVYTKTSCGEQDVIRWKHQLDDAQLQLVAAGVPRADAIDLILTPRVFLKRPDFWKNADDGLATFVAPGFFRAYRLPLGFENEMAVGPHFRVTPLLPSFSDDGHYFVLALSRNRVRLYEGTAHGLRETAAPPAMEEALKSHDRDEVLNLHTHPGAAGTAMQAVFHGHGVGIDDQKAELLRYFQTVDQAVRRHVGPGRAPLVLATVEYLAPIYRRASKYPLVLDEIVPGNPDRLGMAELHAKAYPLVRPHLRERQSGALGRFRQFAGTGQTSCDLAVLLPAARRGELETLFLAAGRQAWGRFDPAADRVEEHSEQRPGDEDLANLAAVHMLRRGRNVFVVPPEPAFDGAPAAGTFHLAMAGLGK